MLKFGIIRITSYNVCYTKLLRSDSGTVTIFNDDTAPVAFDDAASIQEGTTVSGNVLPNDTDADGDAAKGYLSVILPEGQSQIALSHEYGVLTIAEDGSYTFTLNDAGIAARTALDEGETLPLTFADAYQVTDGVNRNNFV